MADLATGAESGLMLTWSIQRVPFIKLSKRREGVRTRWMSINPAALSGTVNDCCTRVQSLEPNTGSVVKLNCFGTRSFAMRKLTPSSVEIFADRT